MGCRYPLISLELVFVGALLLLLMLPYGGYSIRCHNDLRNLTATLLREICTNVTIEPHLQPLTGKHLDYQLPTRKTMPGLM